MFMVDYKSPWLVKIVSDKRRNMSSKRKWKREAGAYVSYDPPGGWIEINEAERENDDG